MLLTGLTGRPGGSSQFPPHKRPPFLDCRYQYLSFVSFLSKGQYMAPYAHGDVRSLAVEREWDGWDDFFKSGSLLLASVRALRGNLLLSCHLQPSRQILKS